MKITKIEIYGIAQCAVLWAVYPLANGEAFLIFVCSIGSVPGRDAMRHICLFLLFFPISEMGTAAFVRRDEHSGDFYLGCMWCVFTKCVKYTNLSCLAAREHSSRPISSFMVCWEMMVRWSAKYSRSKRKGNKKIKTNLNCCDTARH